MAEGTVWALNTSNQVWRWNGRSWDLQISIVAANGNVFFLGTAGAADHPIYYFSGQLHQSGFAVRLGVATLTPYAVNSANITFRWDSDAQTWVRQDGVVMISDDNAPLFRNLASARRDFINTFRQQLSALDAARRAEVVNTLMRSQSGEQFGLVGIGDVSVGIGKTIDWVTEKGKDVVVGVGRTLVNVLQDVNDLIGQVLRVVGQAVGDFGNRVVDAVRLLGDGTVDQAFGDLYKAVGYLVRDIVGGVASQYLAFLGGILGDVVGACAGRSLTADEKRFASAIFGDKVNLDNVQVVTHAPHREGFPGYCLGNTIFLAGDVSADRVAFAHELTHIYQAQHAGIVGKSWDGGGITSLDAGEFFESLGTQDYETHVTPTTHWWELSTEQQAVVVQRYVAYLHSRDTTQLNDYDDNGNQRGGDQRLEDYQRVLQEARFFNGYLNPAGNPELPSV